MLRYLQKFIEDNLLVSGLECVSHSSSSNKRIYSIDRNNENITVIIEYNNKNL
jgi:hypothetical protein